MKRVVQRKESNL